MIWKTNWNAGDKYNIQELDRLLGNFEALKDALADEFGEVIHFEVITTDGYKTYPFEDLLNAVEHNLHELHRLSVNWRSKTVTWIPGGAPPNFEDINRWEHNGEALERAIILVSRSMRYCGTFRAAEETLPQVAQLESGSAVCGYCECGDVECGDYIMRSEIDA